MIVVSGLRSENLEIDNSLLDIRHSVLSEYPMANVQGIVTALKQDVIWGYRAGGVAVFSRYWSYSF